MLAEMRAGLDRLYRRLVMMIGRGETKVVDDSGVVQILQATLTAEEIRDRLPRLAEYGLTSNPPEGTDAIVVFLGGNRSNGVVIATGNKAYRLVGLETGEVALYDDLGQKVHLTRAGIVVDTPLNVTINAGGTLRLSAPIVEIHAETDFRYDVDGHGMHWFPDRVDSWTIGEVAGASHPITPPEIS